MRSPSKADLETARQLLALDGGDDEHRAKVAARTYQKLEALLAPLIGRHGVRTLFVRSLRLAQLEGLAISEGSAADQAANPGDQLSDYLHGVAPQAAAKAAAVVIATFLRLLTTFIGARLTSQVLRGAWPKIELATVEETEK